MGDLCLLGLKHIPSAWDILTKPWWARQFIENQIGNKAISLNLTPFLCSSTIQNKCMFLKVLAAFIQEPNIPQSHKEKRQTWMGKKVRFVSIKAHSFGGAVTFLDLTSCTFLTISSHSHGISYVSYYQNRYVLDQRGYYMAPWGYGSYLRVLIVSLRSECSEWVRDTISTRRQNSSPYAAMECFVYYVDADEMSRLKTPCFIHFRNGDKVAINRQNTHFV